MPRAVQVALTKKSAKPSKSTAPPEGKKQKRAAPSEEEEEEGTDGGEEEPNENALKRATKAVRRKKENKRCSGYRGIATDCGFAAGTGPIAASGLDMPAVALSIQSTKRCMQYVPEVFKGGSFRKEEGTLRLSLSTESVPTKSVRVAQGNMESVMRHLMNEIVFGAVERGVCRIDAAAVQSVLRRHQNGLHFTAVTPPIGVIRHAQREGLLGANASDEADVDADKADCKDLAAKARANERVFQQRKEAFQKRKREREAEPAAVA